MHRRPGQTLVHHGGGRQTLSTKEAELLAYLVAHAGQDIPRDDLYREVWSYVQGTRSRTLDITISRLRKKSGSDPKKPQHLLTLAGIGYRFELPTGAELQPNASPVTVCEWRPRPQ